MTEPDLTRLKNVPAPRDAARRDALAAALSAFDEADQESTTATQGSLPPVRRRDASSRTEGRNPMRSFIHDNRALAASIAALMIAAPAALTLYRQSLPASAPHIEGKSAVRAELAVSELKARATENAPAPATQSELLSAAPMAPAPAPVGALAPQRQLAKKMEAARAVGAANVAMEAQIAHPALREADSVYARQEEYRDKFDKADVNPVKSTAQEPVSTFSIDVDTASYAFARRMINAGRLPQKDSVRVEEFINYFPYNYPKPDSLETPFRPTITVTPSPWNARNRLVHVAVQGYALQSAERPRANLVFLIDVSGSMSPEDRLPLVKNALRLLVDELKPEDTVALVTYASGSGVALESTKIADKGKILAAIDSLGAGGSTAGAQGIEDAYRLAEEHLDKNGVNRVILATDGDFNVGLTDQNALKGFIERKREKGVFLSILGVGQGNYNDALMQTLAQNGNGSAAYVDTLNEARKVLVEEASSTLFPIARDVKIQVEWNPARVSEYRLIGYETRALKREDFNNDAVDAGDVGSGHRVTAIYEITPAGEKILGDDLRYGKGTAKPVASAESQSELGIFKLRYKKPKEDESRLITTPFGDAQAVEKLAAAPEDVRFSIAVAAFGQLLRGAPYVGRYGYDDVIALALGARGDDPFGYRAEFASLARLAKSARP
jgi:Ca-activated chloride channel homolog